MVVISVLIALLIAVIFVIALLKHDEIGQVETSKEPRAKVLQPILVAQGYKVSPEDRVRGSPLR